MVTYLIHDFLKMHGHLAVVKVGECSRIVNQRRDFSLSHFARPESEDKKQGVNDIRLPRAVRPHNGGKGGMKRAYFLSTSVALEVRENQIRDDQT